MKIPTYEEYEAQIIKRFLIGGAEDKESQMAFIKSERIQKDIMGCYKSDVEDLKSGKISLLVFMNGCVASVAYYLSLEYD